MAHWRILGCAWRSRTVAGRGMLWPPGLRCPLSLQGRFPATMSLKRSKCLHSSHSGIPRLSLFHFMVSKALGRCLHFPLSFHIFGESSDLFQKTSHQKTSSRFFSSLHSLGSSFPRSLVISQYPYLFAGCLIQSPPCFSDCVELSTLSLSC